LANPRFVEPQSFNSVCHYGTFKVVARCKGRPFNFVTDYVEHSVNFMTEPELMIEVGYYNRKAIRNIYVMSDARKAVYEECVRMYNLKSKVFTTGPYINGVDFFHREEKLVELKQKYGKILLVFPSHSIENITSDYDVELFISEINKYKKNFDTVFICLYWADILRGMDNVYQENGFVVVTSGHRSDPRFLNRLKDLIFLSDHTMSNNIGAYIGYSICMGKPHFLYTQPVEYAKESGEISIPSPSFAQAKQKIQKCFSSFDSNIKKEQIALVEEYWGKIEQNNYNEK
jgi:hypothetical protein